MRAWLISLGALLTLSCGDDGGGSEPAPTPVTRLEASPVTYTFEEIELGDVATIDVQLRHSGDAETITITGLRFTQVDEEFTFTNPERTALAPGEQVDVRVAYAPADDGADRVQLEIHHDAPQPASPIRVLIESEPPTRILKASPETLDFGVVPRCDTAAQEVTVSRTGATPIEVEAVFIDPNCPAAAAFSITRLAPLPFALSEDAPLLVELSYTPRAAQLDECRLAVHLVGSEPDRLYVTLVGEGAPGEPAVEVFSLGPAVTHDVLLVLDAGGSMADNRAAVLDNLETLAQELAALEAAGGQLQLAITAIGEPEACPETGAFYGSPAVLGFDGLAGLSERAAALFDEACDAPAADQGLETLRRALSAPLAERTGDACVEDAECAAPQVCVDEVCAGPNAGFPALAGPLDVLIISDEDDQSPDPVQDYLDFLTALHGEANAALLHVHAAVGGRDDGCSGEGGAAEPGGRYLDVVEATSGVALDLCAADFIAPLFDLGSASWGESRRFCLSDEPIPETLSVTVADESCEDGWVYDPASMCLGFAADSPCLPAAGEEVRVSYQAACHVE
jgi:hypothetical protein